MDQHAINERDAEEQMFIEAKLRDRSNHNNMTPPCTPSTTPSATPTGSTECLENNTASSHTSQEQAPAPAYGSYLAQNERVSILRARSESIGSESITGTGDSSNTRSQPDIDIASMAMTPEERQLLEAEMRAQHSHPLSMRLEAEESERRLNNEREYYRAQTGRLRELRARRELLHNSMMGGSVGSSSSGRAQAADNSNRDGNNMLTTLPPTSPASRRRHRGSRDPPDGASQPQMGRDWNRIVDAFESSGNGSIQSLDDLVVLEAAIVLSMEEEATRRRGESSGADSNEGEEDEGDANVDAARHAREGFPLARARISRRQLAGEGDDEMNNQVQSLMRGINQRRSRGSSSRGTGYSGRAHDSTLDTASMLMRGMTEEQQIAMAIAASLEDSSQTRTSSEGTSDRSGETSENEHESSSATAAATAALADTTEVAPITQDGALAESNPDEDTPVTATTPSGHESSVTPMVDKIPFPSIEVGVEETATSSQEVTSTNAAHVLDSSDPLAVEENPTPSMVDTEASEDLLDAAAELPKNLEDTAIAEELTIPTDEDSREREASMFQA